LQIRIKLKYPYSSAFIRGFIIALMGELKNIARRIFGQTLAAIDIPATMRRKLERAGDTIRIGESLVDLRRFERIVTIAAGKASYAMARGLVELLAPEFGTSGILAVSSPPPAELPGFEVLLGGHPVPNEASLAAAQRALELARSCDERTLLFVLLSGGGSALFESPLDVRVKLEDLRELNRLLVTCGAPIDEVNAVRKHLSAVKGGRLAAAADRATKITLGVTDVPAGQESALASGPTLPDPTTVADALRVIEQYSLRDKLPASIRRQFDEGFVQETPKAGDAAFAHARFEILLGMHDLFHAAHRAAEAAGFVTVCDNSTDDWPLAQAADALLERLGQLRAQHPARPVCVIADGEVSSPVTGNGIGGRNSAFVLDCVEKIAGRSICVLSSGTDGVDGNSPAAGAVADGESLARARGAGMNPRDFVLGSDAYTFFKRLGDAIETGPTGNNLRDLRILLHV
jgi:hydroxypyruvate reductase